MTRSLHSLLARELNPDEIELVSGGTGLTGGTEHDTFQPGDTSPRTDTDVGGDLD